MDGLGDGSQGRGRKEGREECEGRAVVTEKYFGLNSKARPRERERERERERAAWTNSRACSKLSPLGRLLASLFLMPSIV